MSHDKSPKTPAFQFYVKDFLADGNVSAMTLEQVGAYINHPRPQPRQLPLFTGT